MRKIVSTLFSITIILMCNFSMAQDKPATQKGFINGVDTRTDNMAYWMDKAHKGLVPFNTEIPVNQAEYKSSIINVPGVKTTDSPDIPVTSLTNVTESGNSVFVDPNNANYVLNSNNSTSWSGGTAGTIYGANYFQSADGGLNWGGSEQGAGGNNWGNPRTAIGLNGRQYVNFLTDPGGLGIAYSDDGLSWYTATVASSSYSTDKNHMWIDNSLTSPYEGRLYVAFTSYSGYYANEIVLSYSTNNGLTWYTPVGISSNVSAGWINQGANIQTGPNGEVYVAWAIYDVAYGDETAIGFTKSINGGIGFSTATRIIGNIRGIKATKTSKNHRVNSYPSMACDISGGPNNGNLYIVWANMGTPGVNTGSNISVYMIRSTNGGINWSTPVRVNQNSFEEGKEAYFPWICCDPETGVLTAVFYDDRNTLSSSCEVFSAYSLDAGNTWVDFRVSDVSFSPSPIPGLAPGYMGDYLGITSKGGKVYPCWTDNRSGYMTYVSPYELGLNAGFAADDTEICTGSSVAFTDFSTVYPISWAWSFPGGIPALYNGQNPPPVYYITSGDYDVSLTVSDGIDNDTETKTNYITVKNIVADFSGTPQTLVTGNTVSFTYLSCGSPTSWLWAFPGGTPSSYSGAIPPAITYNTAGTYNVSLTLTGPGTSDTETKTDYINVINCTYCVTSYSNTSNEFISNVNFNTINSSSGSTIYSDFTSLSTDVNPGSSYYISVGITTNYSTYTEHCIVFIDWNQDCDFNDAGESYDLGQTYGSGTLSSIINVPTDAEIGYTSMRVSMRESTNPNGCDVTSRGEAEDYSIYVIDGIGLELSVILEGSYNDNVVNSTLISFLPLEQPYNAAPWNYNGTECVNSISPDYVDWILVELRDAVTAAQATPDKMIARLAAFVKSDGQVVDITGRSKLSFNDTINDNLFVVIHHRNHLSVMSAFPLTESGRIYSHNFPVDENQAYGGNLGQKNLGILNDSEFNYTTALTSGSIYYYKFINGNDWGGVESVPAMCGNYDGSDGYNRVFQVPEKNTVLDVVCFSDCDPCVSTPVQVNVTFQVDMSGESVSPLGVHLAGTFTGWDPSILEMLPSGNDIFIVTVPLIAGELHKYKFINGNDWGSEETVPTECGLANENNNRVILVPSNHLTLSTICFGSCNNCGISPETVYVTFRVNMSNETVSPNGVHVAGNFQGWDPSTSAMNPGIWGMFSGDGDHNGVIDIGDRSPLWENEAGTKGYIFSDYNLDSESNNIDKDNFWLPNIDKASQVPD